jgi:Ser/Thr protein kinase RdoA (MazF antagonist)
MSSALKESFFALTSAKVLDAVEAALAEEKPGLRPTGRMMALNSLENRVYEIEYEDGSFVVAKFYRPHRWSADQILDEHEFLDRCDEIEIPVVCPFSLADSKLSKSAGGETLCETEEGIYFAVFPKVKGRLRDELSQKQLETLGRFLARLHQVGRDWTPEHRLEITNDLYLKQPIEFLLGSDFLDANFKPHYERAAREFLDLAQNRLSSAKLIATHGDCHLGNVLWDGEAPFLMDFDDSLLAPAVQDLWMVVRGRDEQAQKDKEAFLRGYEQMADFDYAELQLIEVLRGIRIIYYSAWIGRRWDDPSFPSAFPQYGSPEYWRSELESLTEILQLLQGHIS